MRFAGGKFTSYQTRDGLSNQIIRCLFEDSEGSLWMGTAGGGINRFKEYLVAVRTMREGLPSDSVRSVQQDGSGDMWLGTGNGIARLRASGGMAVYRQRDGLERDLMFPVVRDRNGNLWALCRSSFSSCSRGVHVGAEIQTSMFRSFVARMFRDQR